MGKPALQASAFSMGRDKQTATRRKDRPTPSCMPQAPPACRHESPGRRNTKDGAARPKDRTTQHQGWSGATPKTEPRNVRDGAVQPKKRNRATSELERRNQKTERRNVGYEAT